MHPMLNTAVRAARQAGRIINRASLDLDTLAVARKQRNDFVTEVDRASEEAIIETQRTAYPGHSILAEESGHHANGRKGHPREPDNIWIIDPLDGTTNFIHGFPQYAVSIALMQKGMVTQAVVYDPSRDELFTASRGRGAFLNGRRIRVSKRIRIEESLIGTGFPFRKLHMLDGYLAMMRAVMERAAGLRRPGAAALDLAYVAAGRLDGFFELGLAPWDAAAGSLLITEAGGMVGNFGAEGDYLFSEQIVAGTPKVFGGLISLLRQHVVAAEAAEASAAAASPKPLTVSRAAEAAEASADSESGGDAAPAKPRATLRAKKVAAPETPPPADAASADDARRDPSRRATRPAPRRVSRN